MSADPYIDQSRINEALIKRIIATGGDTVEVGAPSFAGCVVSVFGWWVVAPPPFFFWSFPSIQRCVRN